MPSNITQAAARWQEMTAAPFGMSFADIQPKRWRMDTSTFLLIRGLVAVVIGILAMAWPGITIAVIVGIFGLYAVIDGITSLMLGLTRTRTHGRSWAVVVQGV